MKKLFDYKVKQRVCQSFRRIKLFGGCDRNNFHFPDGAVAEVGSLGSDLVDDVQAVNHFAEDGVLTVEVLAALGILHNVELRAGRLLGRVGLVAATGGGEGALLVVWPGTISAGMV